MTQIAFLGTGLLGSAFVEAALARNEQVTVWNRTASKARALENVGARFAATPAEAARGAERIHLVLRDDDSVDEVIAQLRDGLSPSAIIIDHTTTLPAKTAARSRKLNAEGVRYLHCPVFIGPAAARLAQGTIMVSGPQALYDRVADALEKQAARVDYLGERPDHAATLKLCGNALIVGIAALVADALTIARNGELTPTEMMSVLQYVNLSNAAAGRGRKMASGDFSPSFELSMARKDVALMLEAAGVAPLAALPGIAERMDTLIKEGLSGSDYGVLAKDALG